MSTPVLSIQPIQCLLCSQGTQVALLPHMQTDTERQTHEEQEYRNEIVADHRFRAQNTLSALNKGLKENKSYTI